MRKKEQRQATHGKDLWGGDGEVSKYGADSNVEKECDGKESGVHLGIYKI